MLADVCRMLGVADAGTAARRVDDDEKGAHTMHTPQVISRVILAGAEELSTAFGQKSEPSSGGPSGAVSAGRVSDPRQARKMNPAHVVNLTGNHPGTISRDDPA